jgi:diguanylate cyclase (GGDEF)-like protein
MRRVELVCAEGSDDLDGLLHLPTAVAAPLRADDRVQGVLYADNRFTGHRLDPVSELVFALIADHAGRAISQAREFDQLAEQARTDSLTGLGHHGAMMGAVAAEVAAAAAREGRVGLVMIDLDDFKLVNDRHGHLVGDALLAAVARRLGTAIRGTGTAFRYGGEEFAVLVGEVDAGALAEVGERLRRTIGERPFVVGTGPAVPITASVGVALCEGAQGSVKGLIGAADGALLAAKAAGKNRVVTGGGARDPRVIGG